MANISLSQESSFTQSIYSISIDWHFNHTHAVLPRATSTANANLA